MPQSTSWKWFLTMSSLPPCTHGDDQRYHIPVRTDVASHPTPLLRIFLSQLSHGAGCSTLALPRFGSQCLIQDPAGSTQWTWESKFMYLGPAPPAAWSCPRAGVLLGGWKLQLSALVSMLPAILGVSACTCQRAALTASSEQLLECGHRSHSVTCMARRVGEAVSSHSLCQERWEQEPRARAGTVGPQRAKRGACAKYGASTPLREPGEGPVPSMEPASPSEGQERGLCQVWSNTAKERGRPHSRAGDVSAFAHSRAAPQLSSLPLLLLLVTHRYQRASFQTCCILGSS